jgi:hypothetical protein
MLGLLAQLLPIDPKVAMDATREAYEGFERNFKVATVIMLLVQNIGWAWAMRGVLRKLSEVQEARVQDGKDGERRAEKLLDRMAVHLDRAAEATSANSMILLGLKKGEETKK